MKHRFLACFLGIGILGLGTVAQASSEYAHLDRFVQEQMSAQHIPGVALAVTNGNQIRYVQGYGSGITPQTQFLIASLSKSFTAMAIMQLVEAGKIVLDAPVQTYLPTFTTADPDAAARISVRHLLNQVSGLADAGFPESNLPQPATIEERVSSLKTAQLVAEPGTAYHYFNPNYGVLARIVEAVSGQPFDAYLQTSIFAPLNMTNTFSALTSDEAMTRAGNLAQGHIAPYGIPLAIGEMSGYLAGSGGMVSTVEDMAHFLIAQSNGGQYEGARVITPESLTLMHTPPAGLKTNYAMGWLTSEHDGVRTIEHSGILSVYYAEMVLLPESKQGIVLLYNINALPSMMLAFPTLKGGLIDLLTGKSPAQAVLTVNVYSLISILVTVLSVGLAVRGLVRLSQWVFPRRAGRFIRTLLGVLAAFVPPVLLILLPRLSAFSGRVYSVGQLVRTMPELYIGLGILSLVGLINGVVRMFYLLSGMGQKRI